MTAPLIEIRNSARPASALSTRPVNSSRPARMKLSPAKIDDRPSQYSEIRTSSRFGSRVVGRPVALPGSLTLPGLHHRPVLSSCGFRDMTPGPPTRYVRPPSRSTILRHRQRRPVGSKRDRRPQRDQPALRGARGDEPEERSVERVDPGRHHADPAEPEREDRVLAVARVVMRRPVGGQDGEVGLAAEPVVERGQQVRDRLVGSPGVLQPARARPRCRPGRGSGPARGRSPAGPVVAQVAVVAEREPAGRVVERLGVGQGQGRQLRWSPQVDERRGRLGRADLVATRVVAERADVAIRAEPAAVSSQPRPSRTRRCRTARAARRTATARRAGTARPPGRRSARTSAR